MGIGPSTLQSLSKSQSRSSHSGHPVYTKGHGLYEAATGVLHSLSDDIKYHTEQARNREARHQRRHDRKYGPQNPRNGSGGRESGHGSGSPQSPVSPGGIHGPVGNGEFGGETPAGPQGPIGFEESGPFGDNYGIGGSRTLYPPVGGFDQGEQERRPLGTAMNHQQGPRGRRHPQRYQHPAVEEAGVSPTRTRVPRGDPPDRLRVPTPGANYMHGALNGDYSDVGSSPTRNVRSRDHN
ncbi:MAG: hypothetical protein Q9190_005365 [Brigantiaea leucoxantha]